MRIDPTPPYALSPRPKGTRNLNQESFQISVLPDCSCEIKYRNGIHVDLAGDSMRRTRWALLSFDNGVKIYIHGTHVVITRQDLLPT